LDIIEDVSDKEWGLDRYCHRFAFFLIAFVDEPQDPTIDYISPTGAYDLDPFQPLVITIYFSGLHE
jgi:hypothetical protein